MLWVERCLPCCPPGVQAVLYHFDPTRGATPKRALREGTCDLRQQGEQADKVNFRESVEPEVFARFLGCDKGERGASDDLLPVPKVKTEIGKTFLFYKGEILFLPVIAASLL
jgi:hypothetical protein